MTSLRKNVPWNTKTKVAVPLKYIISKDQVAPLKYPTSTKDVVKTTRGRALRALRREELRVQVNSLSKGHEYAEQNKLFESLTNGFKARCEADSDFVFKLVWEVIQDQGIIIFTLLTTIGLPNFWSPEQLAHAGLLHSTAFFNDILLVYFLASTKKGGSSKGKCAHMFEEGLQMSERLSCWVNKFRLYAPLGMLTGVLSCLILNRCMSQPVSAGYLSKVGFVGLLHLGVSANTRYQVINGVDLFFYKKLDKETARGCTIFSRIVNQVAGGRLFLLLSTLIL